MAPPSYETLIDEAARMVQSLHALSGTFQRVAEKLISTLQNGGKILTCGNGGSAPEGSETQEALRLPAPLHTWLYCLIGCGRAARHFANVKLREPIMLPSAKMLTV